MHGVQLVLVVSQTIVSEAFSFQILNESAHKPPA